MLNCKLVFFVFKILNYRKKFTQMASELKLIKANW